MIVLAYLLVSISVSSIIVGIFTLLIIAHYCFFFAHCTCFLYFVLITLVTIGGQH